MTIAADGFGRTRAVVVALPLLAAFVACESAPPPSESTSHTSSAVFTNGSFETGAAGNPPPSWTVTTGLSPNPNGVTVQTPETRAGLNLTAGGVAKTVILNAPGGPLTQADANLGATASLRWPRYGNQCALVNEGGNNENANSLTQTMTIAAGDVDPNDGKIHVRFVVAPVLQNPAHLVNQQPYYFVQLTNVTRANAILYSDFNLSAQPGVPWKTINGGTVNEIDYTDWQLVDISPSTAQLAMGDVVTLEVIATGCSLGGHFGQVYVDGVGSTVPGLYVSGTGPAQANAGTNITYTITYHNGSASAETGVVIDLTTPPGTTYQSIVPPAGATCVTPAVGAAGTIVCTFSGPVPAGAVGSFGITLNINAGTTGTIVEGTYDIHSTQETALLGSHIITTVGCTADAQCSAGNWCNETANACTPTLANGTAVPTDGLHTGPTLNGLCTAGAGTLVCTSQVCDTNDNECGYLNGDGPCTGATAGAVCRSGVCDPDLKCGYANGDGPCTVVTGPLICRSGACSTNGKCEPAGGCNVDADCTGGNWCNETAHACTPKLANGTTLPTDGAHMAPTLNGMCTSAAATLVCVSGVCDTNDNKCGYLNLDGPCTVANGGVLCRSLVCDPDLKCGYAVNDGPCTVVNQGTVCRSGACSSNGKCEPPGGCNVDTDCTLGNWCNESVHTCTAKLANGTAVPTDGPHMSPTLNGTCTIAAGTLVCVSAVCDVADNECGYAIGDGPCTVATGPVVCRSGACSLNNKCTLSGGCNVDADCANGNWCKESTHTCTAKLANGSVLPSDPPHATPTLDGTCTTAAATLVCVSGVCDTDNKCGLANPDGPCTVANGPTLCRSGVCDPDLHCGYAVGDGPCTTVNQGTVCRSGSCASNGTCTPMGGCNVDADCTGGKWCSEATHTCTAQLANGTAIPTDAPHTSPTLNGTCTTAAATLVCVSTVCDTHDDKCGYANGDGPCTTTNGGTVCRSGMCSTSGVCIPTAGCAVDADCTTGQWCNASACVPKLPNGTPVPTVGGHAPPLTGTCSTAVGAAVCLSGVCDTKDNECGLANGDGPCANMDQCRSDHCNTTQMVCVVCQADNDCPSNETCDKTAGVCKPKPGTDGGVSIDSGVPQPDSGAPQADSGPLQDDGSIEGGGCAVSPSASTSSTAFSGIAGIVIALGALARRRKR